MSAQLFPGEPTSTPRGAVGGAAAPCWIEGGSGGTAASGLVATREGALLAQGSAIGDHVGTSVGVSGDTAIVGAPGKAGFAGAAHVFVRGGGGWIQEGELVAHDRAAEDELGGSVSVSGDTAIVGAPGKARLTGAAYVFVRRGTIWAQEAKLAADGSAAGDCFGRSVGVSGDTAVVGAASEGHRRGAVHVFVREGARWALRDELVACDADPRDCFGGSVSVSGDTIVVGAPWRAGFRGAAYVFVRTGARWEQQAKLLARDAVPGDELGYAVSVSGDTAVIGAHGRSTFRGAAYVFVRRGARWEQQARLVAIDGAIRDYAGYSVGVSGDTAIVGAHGKEGAGAAYVFARTGDRWEQQAKIVAGNDAVDDAFGLSVGVSGDTAIVGGYKPLRMGAAYVFGLRGASGARRA